MDRRFARYCSKCRYTHFGLLPLQYFLFTSTWHNSLCIIYNLFNCFWAPLQNKLRYSIANPIALPNEKSWTLASSLFRRFAPYSQTKIGGSAEPPISFCFLEKSLKFSYFRNNHNGLVLPCFKG